MAHPLTPSFLLLALLLEQHRKLCATTSFAGYVGLGGAEGFSLIPGWWRCKLWGCLPWVVLGKAVCSSPGNQDRLGWMRQGCLWLHGLAQGVPPASYWQLGALPFSTGTWQPQQWLYSCREAASCDPCARSSRAPRRGVKVGHDAKGWAALQWAAKQVSCCPSDTLGCLSVSHPRCLQALPGLVWHWGWLSWSLFPAAVLWCCESLPLKASWKLCWYSNELHMAVGGDVPAQLSCRWVWLADGTAQPAPCTPWRSCCAPGPGPAQWDWNFPCALWCWPLGCGLGSFFWSTSCLPSVRFLLGDGQNLHVRRHFCLIGRRGHSWVCGRCFLGWGCVWLVSAAIRGMPHRHPLHRALLLYWGKMIFKP